MDAKQARRAWLQQFLSEFDGKRNELARAAGIPAPQITMILRDGPNQRNMGDQLARRLETWKGLARGTLDRPPTLQELPSGVRDVPAPYDLPAPDKFSQEELDLVDAYRALAKEQRDAVWTVIDAYLRSMHPEVNRALGPRDLARSRRIEPKLITTDILRRAELERTSQAEKTTRAKRSR